MARLEAENSEMMRLNQKNDQLLKEKDEKLKEKDEKLKEMEERIKELKMLIELQTKNSVFGTRVQNLTESNERLETRVTEMSIKVQDNSNGLENLRGVVDNHLENHLGNSYSKLLIIDFMQVRITRVLERVLIFNDSDSEILSLKLCFIFPILTYMSVRLLSCL